jgi:hypothetical protein
MINYFSPAPSPEEEALRKIKDNYRHKFVSEAIQKDGFDSIPSAWLDHNLSMTLT